MIDKNTRGSEWRKWDLHIHSNASDGKGTPLEIITEAKAKGLSAIALTDHHTVSNIDRIKELGIKEGIFVIAGIEFRSELGGKSVHFIGLFPEDNNSIILDSKALNELVLNPLNISETAIIAKGREKNPALSPEEAFKRGMFLVQVDFKKASKLIHSLGGLISVHNGTKENGLDAEVKHQGSSPRNVQELYDSLGTLKEELMKDYIDICEIRKENDSDIFYLDTFNKPSIIASDAHDLNEVGSKSVWIKADTTFQGLKQITFEPRERVRIPDELPDQKNDYNVIESIIIDHPDFSRQLIPLNQNLNTIIGGRSSGKSILLGSIAKKIGTNRHVKEKNPNYEAYIKNDLLPVFNVIWRDEIKDSQRNIEYFPQSYINSLAAQSNDVNKLIEDTVKSDEGKREAIENYVSYCIENKSKINQEVFNYYAFLEQLTEKQKEIIAQGTREGIEKQILKFKEEQDAIKDTMKQNVSEDEENNYKSLQNELGQIESDNSSSSALIHQIETLKQIKIANSIEDDLIGFEEELTNRLKEKYAFLRSEFEKGFINELNLIIQKESDLIKNRNIRTRLIEADETYTKCKSHFNQNSVYLEVVKKLQGEEKKLNQIETFTKVINTLKSKMKNKFIVILDLHNGYYTNAVDLVKKLNYSHQDVSISATPKFKKSDFQKLLAVRFNQKSFDVQEIVNYEYKTNEEYLQFMKILFQNIHKEEIPLKVSYNKQQVLIDLFAENHYEIEYDVLFQGDSLSSMSEGKKAFIILRILLDFNDQSCPILIDQPEDDLDNRAIYDQLVEYLRKKKKERQIILVTHNPNIVVGADAEEVIVANQNGINSPNQDDVKFEYISGSLENSTPYDKEQPVLSGQGIKEHVCDILEGGNEAFLKREKKYGIKK